MTDIWIAGLGLQTVSQVTREVELAIRSSREVLYLDTGVATRSFLEPLCPRITPLYEESYSEEGPRGNLTLPLPYLTFHSKAAPLFEGKPDKRFYFLHTWYHQYSTS
jgi:hypothetical protein